MSPLIGIVPTQMPEEHIFRVNDYYINSIVLSGGVPLILPLTYDKEVYERLFPLIDGFVLTGGQDVDPKRYTKGGAPKAAFSSETGLCAALAKGGAESSEPPRDDAFSQTGTGEITPLRDIVETAILDFAYTYDVPLLGICRGMQTMNVYFGGTLYQDLPSEFDGVDALSKKPLIHWQTEDPDEVSHYIDIRPGSTLHEIVQADSSAANSFHHQGVREIAKGFEASAYSSDGLVEAIEAKDRSFMLGVQWHPEFFLGERHMGNIFSRLIQEAARAREDGRLEASEGFTIAKMSDKEPQHGVALLHSIRKSYSI